MNGGHDGFDSNGLVLDFQTIQRDVLGRKGDASDRATRPNHHIQKTAKGVPPCLSSPWKKSSNE
jgi:hypothetical protein